MAWATIATLWLWQGSQQRRWLLVAGFFAGFAFGSKYTAGLVALLAVVYILVEERRPSRALAWFSLTALLAAAPWLLKNMLATANPFYPLLLPGGAMDEIRLRLYQGFPPQVGWLDTLGLPLRATLWGIEGAHLGDAPGYEASIGPLLLGLGVFAGLGRAALQEDSRALLRIAAIFSLGGLLLWALAGALSGHLIRTHLYYSLFAAFAILAGFAFAALMRLPRPRWRFDLLLQGLVVLALASGTVGAFGAARPTQSEAQYLRENLGLFAIVMDYLDEDLPDDARILMLWEARGYYCQPKCDSDELIDRWQHNIELLGSSEAVLQAWRSGGYSHVLYHRQAAEFVYQDPEHFHPFDLPKLEAGLDTLELIENFNDSYLLYSLEE